MIPISTITPEGKLVYVRKSRLSVQEKNTEFILLYLFALSIYFKCTQYATIISYRLVITLGHE